MAATLITTSMAAGVNFTYITDTSSDWGSVPNSTYFYDKVTKLVYKKDSNGNIVDAYNSQYSGGLCLITNQTTGAPTFYSTLEAARDAAISGDTIFVYPGTYTVTTTATNGLSKDGVDWFFYPKTFVSKSTAGVVFAIPSTFTIGHNVLGYGKFTLSGSATYFMQATNIVNTFSIEFDTIISSTATQIIWSRYGSKELSILGRTLLKSTGGVCIETDVSTLINCPSIISTASNAIRSYGNTAATTTINSGWVQSTSTYAVHAVGGVFNIGYCAGLNAGYLWGFNYYGVGSVNGNTNGMLWEGLGTEVSLNGKCNILTMNDTLGGQLIGGTIGDGIILTNGYIDTTIDGRGNPSTLQINGGLANLKTNNSKQLKIWVTAGVCNLTGTLNTTTRGDYFESYVSGGRLNLTGLHAKFLGGKQWIRVTSTGVLNLGNATLVQTATSFGTDYTWDNTTIIRMDGGTLISNGATLYQSDPNGLVICSTTSTKNIKVLSSGLNTNVTGILDAKKMKRKYTVTAVATTTIILNDGTGGGETFTENNLATYSTRALLAQRIAALINASGTLDITATQDTPGTDVYFYCESDVASVPFVSAGLVNLTELGVRENSYGFTLLGGGDIIEDSNVE